MVHTIWVRSRRMTRASGMNSRALWRNVRGIQTAPFSATPKAPRTMATSVPARLRGSSSSSGLKVAQAAASGRLEAIRLASGYVRRTISATASAADRPSSSRKQRAAAAFTTLSRNSARGSSNVMGVNPSGPLSRGAGLLALRASSIVSLLFIFQFLLPYLFKCAGRELRQLAVASPGIGPAVQQTARSDFLSES